MASQLDEQFKIKRNKHVSDKEIKITKDFQRRKLINNIIEIVLFIVFIAFAGWTAFIAYTGPVKDTRYNITYKLDRQSTPKIGNKVVYSKDTDNIGTRLIEGIIGSDKVSSGKIVGGPYGEIYGGNGTYDYQDEKGGNRQTLNIIGVPKNHENTLNKEYIVSCGTGACKKGSYYFMNEKQIKGIYGTKNPKLDDKARAIEDARKGDTNEPEAIRNK